MQVNFSTQLPEFDARLAQQIDVKSSKKDSEIRIEPVEEKQIEPHETEILKNVLAEHNISLKFGRDEETEQIVVEMIDSKTGDVVRQIPSEVSIALGKVFEKIQGRFIDKRI